METAKMRIKFEVFRVIAWINVLFLIDAFILGWAEVNWKTGAFFVFAMLIAMVSSFASTNPAPNKG